MSKKPSNASDDSVEFNQPPSDGKGHSTMLTARIPPYMAMEMEQIFASRKFPYRTESDMVRHAIVRHLRWLRSMQPIDSPYLPMLEMMMAVVRETDEQNRCRKMLDDAWAAIRSLAKEGHESKARGLIDTLLAQAEKMRDPYWSEKYRKGIVDMVIRGKLGHLVRGRATSIRPTSMPEGEDRDE